VILEPDALAHLSCLSESDRTTRVQLLGEAVARLEERPGVSVYIDAGNPGWIGAEDMADLLVAAGCRPGPGVRAERLELPLDGALRRLCAGALRPSRRQERSHRHQPQRRRLERRVVQRDGTGPSDPPPSHDAADPAVDAYLWVKTPGESDGECNGGPSAGEWWPEYALDLAARAAY
jgi:endoglucanase